LLVGLPKLNELLYELLVAKHSIGVVRRIVDDSAEAELSGRRADAQAEDEQDCEDSFFHGVFSLREVVNLSSAADVYKSDGILWFA
jgi:hypothetical protein